MFKVPEACGTSNNELGNTNNEGVDPEETEDIVEECVSGECRPLNFGKEWIIITLFRCSRGEYHGCATKPEERPDADNEI